MELSFTQLLLGAAGLHVLLALILAVRALDTRAGGWSLVLGLLFAGHAGALSLVVHGYPRAALLLWVIHTLIPLGIVPLAIAVATRTSTISKPSRRTRTRSRPALVS